MEIHNLLIAIFILYFLFIFSIKKKNKHEIKIKKSKHILKKLGSFQHDGQRINYLKKIDPFVFEELLLSAFEKKGYRIKRNKRYTGDGGIDGVIFDKNNQMCLIQAKRYSEYINLQHIKEFGNLLEKKKCKGFFVHTGKTGKESFKQMNLYRNMEIISGDRLISLINQ